MSSPKEGTTHSEMVVNKGLETTESGTTEVLTGGDPMDIDIPPPTSSSGTLDSSPKAGQTIIHDGRVFTTIREGRAYILAPLTTSENAGAEARGRVLPQPKKTSGAGPSDDSEPNYRNPAQAAVFYNPIQQFNRDLSVLAIRAFGSDLLVRREAVARKTQELREKSSLGRKNKKRRKIEEANKSTDPDECNSGPADIESSSSAHLAAEQSSVSKSLPPLAFTILDALSATGLRAMRYALELPFPTQIIGNDLSPTATDLIKLNALHNQVSDKVGTITGNAMATMYARLEAPEPLFAADSFASAAKPTKFDVIDLDPYGTAAIFLDSAIQAVSDGGMICVTCTDSSVFASAGYPEKTFSLYGGLPTKGPYSHETALRLIVQAVATSAATHGLAVEPLLSLSIDYYVRIFIRVRRSPAEVKFLAGKTMLVYACDAGCGAWQTQLLGRNVPSTGKNGKLYYKHTAGQAPTQDSHCLHCGFKTHLAGPMWAGPLHNGEFIDRMLDLIDRVDGETVEDDGEQQVYGTIPRLEGMLMNAKEELKLIDMSEPVPAPRRDNSSKKTKKGTKRPAESLDNSEIMTADGTDDPISTASTVVPPPTTTATFDSSSPFLFSRVPIPVLDHHPFYVFPSQLSRIVHTQSPPENAFRSALRHAGFQAACSHTKPGATKTDAPWSAIWHIMREWVRQCAPIKEGKLIESMAGWTVMNGGIEAVRRMKMEARIEEIVKKRIESIRGEKAVSDDSTVGEASAEVSVAEAIAVAASPREPVRAQSPSEMVDPTTTLDQDGTAHTQTVQQQQRRRPSVSSGLEMYPHYVTFKFPVIFNDPETSSAHKKGKSKNKNKSEVKGGDGDIEKGRETDQNEGEAAGDKENVEEEEEENDDGAEGQKARRVVRYQLNPEKNWGPMRRAKAR